MNLLEEFLKNKEDNGLSQLTIKNYRIDLTQFLPYLFNKCLEDINVTDLKLVTIKQTKTRLEQLQAENNYTPTTINRRLASFKSFMTYHCRTKNIENAVHTMRAFNDTRLHETEFIELEDVKKILEKAKRTDTEMYYVLGMLFNTGMRSAELLSLTIEDVHEDCIVVVGKYGKMRRVELNSIAKDCIKSYVKLKGVERGKILNMPYVTLRRHFTKFLRKCNVNCSSLHITRKSFATNLIEKGGHNVITDVAKLLGHANGSQTLEKHYLGSTTKKVTVSLLE